MPKIHDILIACTDGVLRVKTGYYENHQFIEQSSRLATNDDYYPFTLERGGNHRGGVVDLLPSEIPIKQMTSPSETLSGSSNTHARLAPSSSKSWTRCTRSISYIEENKDRILPIKIAEVMRLTPYLQSIPEEEVFAHEWFAITVVKLLQKGVYKMDELTEAQVSAIYKTAGSEAAREGTRAHEFSAAILLGQKTLEDIPSDFRPHVKLYVDYCNGRSQGERFVESKVPLFYSENPEDTGTCDFCVISDERIDVIDLKYGAGMLVEAHENEQLAIYALSFVEDNAAFYDFDPSIKVAMTICQPRHREAGDFKTWEITLKELRDFCRDIHEAAIQIRVNNPLVIKFAPSADACQWCDAKKFCAARAASLTECMATPDASGFDFISALPDLSKEDEKAPVATRLESRTMTPVEIGEEDLAGGDELLELTDERLMRIWNRSKGLRAFLDDIEEYINDRALTGDTFDGEVKLVQGREGNRAWVDEDAVDAFLKGQKLVQDERYNYKLKSPAQIEVLLKDKLAKTTRTKNLFESHITRSQGKLVAAPVSDKRPAVLMTTGFEEIDDDDDGLS